MSSWSGRQDRLLSLKGRLWLFRNQGSSTHFLNAFLFGVDENLLLFLPLVVKALLISLHVDSEFPLPQEIVSAQADCIPSKQLKGEASFLSGSRI